MAYVTQAEVQALLPPETFLQALDANQNGVVDSGLFTSVEASVAAEIDGLLAPAVDATAFTSTPAAVKAAALVLCCEALHRRLGSKSESNPWIERAKTWRERLEKIGRGELALLADTRFTGGGIDAVDGDWDSDDQDGC